MKYKKGFLIACYFIWYLVAFFLGLGYISQHVSPLRGDIFYLFSLVVWYIQLSSWIALILAIIQKNRYWVGLLVVLHLIGIKNYRVTYAFNSPQKCSEGCVKVLSYNVKNFELGTHQILKEIAVQQPDVVCLQEVWEYKRFYNSTYNAPNPLESLQNMAKLPYLFFYPRIKENFGLAILSKYPILHKGIIPFKTNGINGMMYVDILYKNKPLRIYNVHLQSMNLMYNPQYEHETGKIKYDTPDKRRYLLRQLTKSAKVRTQQLDLLLNSMEGCPYPIILTGDLNSTPYSHLYNRLTKKLQDNFTVSGRGFGYTFDKYPLRIDYILSDKRLKPMHTFTHKTIHSDHSMVISYIAC